MTKNKSHNYVWWWMVTRFIVVITVQYIHILYHYIVCLKLICYMPIISQLKKTQKTKQKAGKTVIKNIKV